MNESLSLPPGLLVDYLIISSLTTNNCTLMISVSLEQSLLNNEVSCKNKNQQTTEQRK